MVSGVGRTRFFNCRDRHVERPTVAKLGKRLSGFQKRRGQPSDLLEPASDQVHVERIKLHAVADAPDAVGGDECSAPNEWSRLNVAACAA